MSLITAAITMYFIGLGHLRGRDGGRAGREVVVPLATTTPTFGGKTLEDHQADIVIEGLAGGMSACTTTLGGSWKNSICTIEKVSGKIVQLPQSTDSFSMTTIFGSVPRLRQTLCATLGDIDSQYMTDATKYAARLTLTNGTLSACTVGKAWVSYLTLTDVSGNLIVGGKSVGLNNGAIVYVINAPPRLPDPDQDKHFWWYYLMYKGAGCTQIPQDPTTNNGCPANVHLMAHRHGVPAATGVGCSNTSYP